MKNKKIIIYGLIFTLAISFIYYTPTISNLFGLLTEQSNFIPQKSSIFTFRPYVINQG